MLCCLGRPAGTISGAALGLRVASLHAAEDPLLLLLWLLLLPHLRLGRTSRAPPSPPPPSPSRLELVWGVRLGRLLKLVWGVRQGCLVKLVWGVRLGCLLKLGPAPSLPLSPRHAGLGSLFKLGEGVRPPGVLRAGSTLGNPRAAVGLVR